MSSLHESRGGGGWPAVALGLGFAAVGAATGVVTNLILQSALPTRSIPAAGLAGLLVLALALVVALARPYVGLIAAVTYLASPLSYYILFRGTSQDNPYPSGSAEAIDAVCVLGLAGAALAGEIIQRWRRRDALLPRLPAHRSMAVILVLLSAGAVIGLAGHHRVQDLLADVVPYAELLTLYVLTMTVVTDRRRARGLVLAVVISLGLTAMVKLALYLAGPGALGVDGILLGSTYRARLYLNYTYGWFLPFALALALFAGSRRARVLGLAALMACGLMVVLTFERGLWLSTALAAAAVLAYGIRHRPRAAASLLAAGLVAVVLLGVLLGRGSSLANPFSLIGNRILYTQQQLNGTDPLQHKRQDEARLLWQDIRSSPVTWPLGRGLGATYVGPTGITSGDYAQGFTSKHYSFNWYLVTVLRLGFIGLAASLWLLGALAALGVKLMRSAQARLTRAMGLAAVAGLAGLALVSVIDPYLLAHPLAPFEGATFGLIAVVLASPALAHRR